MRTPFDRTRTLAELEQDDWSEPEFPSHLITTCHRLRRKPLDQFSVEDLRIMIGQGIGLPYLIPLAIERLAAKPLAAGDCYRGDLLLTVLKVDATFWHAYPDYHHALTMSLQDLAPRFDSVGQAWGAFAVLTAASPDCDPDVDGAAR